MMPAPFSTTTLNPALTSLPHVSGAIATRRSPLVDSLGMPTVIVSYARPGRIAGSSGAAIALKETLPVLPPRKVTYPGRAPRPSTATTATEDRTAGDGRCLRIGGVFPLLANNWRDLRAGRNQARGWAARGATRPAAHDGAEKVTATCADIVSERARRDDRSARRRPARVRAPFRESSSSAFATSDFQDISLVVPNPAGGGIGVEPDVNGSGLNRWGSIEGRNRHKKNRQIMAGV